MKIGISTYSFNSLYKTGEFTDFDAVVKAGEMGFDVVEFAGLKVPENSSIEKHAAKIADVCREAGIEVGNYTVSADLLTGSNGDPSAEIERLKKEVDTASILGSPGMRHDATFGPKSDKKNLNTFNEVLPILINGCREVTRYAKELGVKTMIENHGYFCQDSDRVELIFSGVDHENFGLLVDIGNFMCVDEDPIKAVGKLIPYAFNVHIKDFHFKSGMEPDPGKGWFTSRGGNYLRGAVIGHGVVPVFQCVNLIKKTGYSNTISVEFEGLEESLLGISLGLDNLKKYI